MRKQSEVSKRKYLFLAHLEHALHAMSDVAEFASTADARLVELAAKGFKSAERWTSDTTETNQNHCKREALVLQRNVAALVVKTDLTLALNAYGQALADYAHCRYNESSVNASTALRLMGANL